MQNIGLLIADEVQQVGGEVGPTYEVIISRTRYVSAQTEVKIRIVACGVSLANARGLGSGLVLRHIQSSTSHQGQLFSPRPLVLFLTLRLYFSARPLDMDIHIQSFSISHFPSLMISMSKLVYLAIAEYSPTKPVIIFVPGASNAI